MAVTEENRERYTNLWQLGQSYEEAQNNPAFKDLMGYMNQYTTHAFNLFLTEPTDRNGGVSDSSLRGQVQMISLINNYIKARISEGRSAANELAKLNKQ